MLTTDDIIQMFDNDNAFRFGDELSVSNEMVGQLVSERIRRCHHHWVSHQQ